MLPPGGIVNRMILLTGILAIVVNAAAQTPVALPPRPGQSAPAASVTTAPQEQAPETMPPVDGQRIKQEGVEYIDIQVGSGALVQDNSWILIRKTVWNAVTGKLAFSDRPLNFVSVSAIRSGGWLQGDKGMRAGGIRRVFIPAGSGNGGIGKAASDSQSSDNLQVGAGITGNYLVPPNTDIICDFEITSVSDYPSGPKVKQVPGVSGPTLEETLNFIGERLAQSATVNFITFGTNTADGSNGSGHYSEIEGPFHIDTDACLISNRQKISINGQPPVVDRTVQYSFNQFEEVIVKPAEQYLTEMNTQNPQPTLINSTNPPAVALLLRLNKSSGFVFFFLTDASIADRVAKAMTHAIELCGGGRKDPF
jgi:hypothetical protein